MIIDGIEYVPKSDAKLEGDRHVLVLDKGFIFVGNLEDRDGRIWMTNCHNLRRWGKNGFGGAVEDPIAAEVELDRCPDFSVPMSVELMRLPVPEGWAR